MNKIFFSFLCLIFSLSTFAQDESVSTKAVAIPEADCTSADQLAAYIKEHFVSDSSRLQAIYVWVGSHISYDTERMQAVIKKLQQPPQAVADVIKSRKAVCQGYADLFTAVCKGVGINATVVAGYVKQFGRIIPIGHAWVAAELNGEWLLFDPTWSAGYLDNNMHFVKHFNYTFYKIKPADFIVDHMPFDPLYQFLSTPLNNSEFIDGKITTSKPTFNFRDSLIQFNKLSTFEQMQAQLRRLEAGGIENDLIAEQRKYLTINLQSQSSGNTFQEAGVHYSTAVNLLNKYYSFKNKQFTTIADNELVQAVDSMKHYIILARSLLSKTVTQTPEQQAAKNGNLAGMDQYWKTFTQEEQFVQQYINTDKARRIELFMKRL